MKKRILIFMLCILLAFSGCAEENHEPEKEEPILNEEAKEPTKEPVSEPDEEWIFEPQSEFPLFLKEIFEEGTEIYDQTDKAVENITVLGDENEFFVTYEYMAREGKKKEFNDDCWLRIYGTKTDDGKYVLEHRGGGYQGEMNLETSDITVSDVWEGREAGYDAALSELIENLKPTEVFDAASAYPEVIGEIFEMITGEMRSNISDIEVLGGANEFFARYDYSSETEDSAVLKIRIRINNDGFYTLIAEGGGPMDHGLDKTDITLEDIR